MNNKRFVFVCDLFHDQYIGGAELTTAALMQNREKEIQKVNCQLVDSHFISSNKNKRWIIGNFASLTDKAKYEILKNNIQYWIIEYDYKYCIHRNPSLHILREGKCECEKTERIKLLNLFFHGAQQVFYMSEIQKQIYSEKMKRLDNGVVLSSVFKKEKLEYIDNLNKEKNEKWLIYKTDNYLKGTENSIKYAIDNALEYQTFSNLAHEELIRLLAKSKGLIFLPNGEDTCPRLVIEAKLCHCEVICNDKVQHYKEEWFQNVKDCMEHMSSRYEYFWSFIDESN